MFLDLLEVTVKCVEVSSMCTGTRLWQEMFVLRLSLVRALRPPGSHAFHVVWDFSSGTDRERRTCLKAVKFAEVTFPRCCVSLKESK